MEKKFLSLREAAKRLGIARNTLYKRLLEGKVKGEKNPISGRWSVPIDQPDEKIRKLLQK
ncbi:MAG: hypothetical protein L0Y56_18185 [Nitrospira sp.]|nr:hypothetical protein [Nitrospira sp.]